jgi:hypothetical protein
LRRRLIWQILTSQNAPGKRAVDHRTDPVFLAARKKFNFGIAIDNIVQRLGSDHGGQIQPVGHPESVAQLETIKIRAAHVSNLPLMYQIIHSPKRLFQRRVVVGPVEHVKIDMIRI